MLEPLRLQGSLEHAGIYAEPILETIPHQVQVVQYLIVLEALSQQYGLSCTVLFLNFHIKWPEKLVESFGGFVNKYLCTAPQIASREIATQLMEKPFPQLNQLCPMQ